MTPATRRSHSKGASTSPTTRHTPCAWLHCAITDTDRAIATLHSRSCRIRSAWGRRSGGCWRSVTRSATWANTRVTRRQRTDCHGLDLNLSCRGCQTWRGATVDLTQAAFRRPAKPTGSKPTGSGLPCPDPSSFLAPLLFRDRYSERRKLRMSCFWLSRRRKLKFLMTSFASDALLLSKVPL